MSNTEATESRVNATTALASTDELNTSESDLERYLLPDPPYRTELRDALRASLRLLDVAGEAAVFPLYCAVWRAPLAGCDSGQHLVGPTGSGKSELAALAQQHYGAGLDARHLPGNWSSTDNALESLAFVAKDALVVVDDFCPGGRQYDVQAMHRKADRLFRAQGNTSGRQRLSRDSTLRAARPPKGTSSLPERTCPWASPSRPAC